MTIPVSGTIAAVIETLPGSAPPNVGRRAGRKRPDILRSAGHVIAERGMEETRFVDVAKRSGASISTLQYLFGSREDLLIASLRQSADDFLASTRELASSIDDPGQRLLATVRDMLSVDSPDEQAYVDWAVWIEFWRAASRDSELAVEAQQTYVAWNGLLADAVMPLTDGSTDVSTVAAAAMAMIDGFGIQIILTRGTFDRTAAAATVLKWIGGTLGRDDLG
jgi:AcrR family transcriptional regulator